jgi:hypothetical protein
VGNVAGEAAGVAAGAGEAPSRAIVNDFVDVFVDHGDVQPGNAKPIANARPTSGAVMEEDRLLIKVRFVLRRH